MNYIGSKNKLSEFISSSISKTTGDLKDKTFADVFSGTSIVSRIFKSKVKNIICNDLEPYSYVLMRNYIGNNAYFDSENLIESMNRLPDVEGFIFENYCAGGKFQRLYFSDENGKKIDSIRLTIKDLYEKKQINENQYYFLLASLMESADKVANTASVYAAYLKKLKKSAEKKLVLTPAFFEETKTNCFIYNEDANELLGKIKGDILYLDPPYNGRQYGANYHLLNTIALYDDFVPRGKTGLREYPKSDYCKKGKVEEVFEDLISKADFEYIFLSYNNEGLVSDEKLKSMFSKFGKYSCLQIKYQRFKADKDINRQHKATSTFENLHILKKKS